MQNASKLTHLLQTDELKFEDTIAINELKRDFKEVIEKQFPNYKHFISEIEKLEFQGYTHTSINVHLIYFNTAKYIIVSG